MTSDRRTTTRHGLYWITQQWIALDASPDLMTYTLEVWWRGRAVVKIEHTR